jgi:hypothetical protein
MPKWPANDAPTQASIKWNSAGLLIDANNASLSQILTEVSTDTGAKVDGIGADERVFGQYGPGKARDVLSDLLQGSGYDFLLVGELGQGTPREIILSAHHAGPAVTPAAHRPQETPEEDAPEPEEPQQPQPPPMRPPGSMNQPPRTPQQMQEMIQQRQQNLQNQQNQQNQQQNPQQPPP